MYTWHFTFGTQPAVQALAAGYQDRLRGLPGLDIVPERWLHLTTQGVGFQDEVSDQDATAIVQAAADQLRALPPQQVTLGPAKVTPEAILLDVTPVTGLTAIRTGLRAATAKVWDASRVMESDQWTPHVSVAYSNGTGLAAPYVDSVAGGGTAEATIGEVQLIVLNRDEHMYEWTTYAAVQLKG